MQETIKQIIKLANLAPSGDNNQPWRFAIKSNQLFLYNIPERDTTLYNYKQHAAYIAHGTVIENCIIAGSHYQLSTIVDLLTNGLEPNLVAKLTFIPEEKIEESPLFTSIKQRATNRKPFKTDLLHPDQKADIENLILGLPDIQLNLIEDVQTKKLIAQAASQGDRLIFENKPIHDFLFNCIRWTEEEENKTHTGLYLKTMELNPIQVQAFKLFKNWKVMKFFNRLGFPKLAVKGNIPLYSNNAGLGTLVIANEEPQSFINTGRALQRIWLYLTKIGMHLHPMAGVPLLMQFIRDGELNHFSQQDISIISKSYEIIEKSFNIENDKKIIFLFRFGKADKPSGYSSRKEPQVELKD
jgi:hypothetical protein